MVDPTKSPLEYLCDATFQTVVRNLAKGYIVVGSTAEGQLGSAAAGGGVDLVWDLWNEQFAAYAYPQGGLSYFNISAGVTAYAGFGFGLHDHVHSAWSGWFRGGTAAIELSVYRLISLEGSLSYFESPDRSTVGGLVGVGASVGVPRMRDFVRLPLGLSAAGVAAGYWTPFDTLTRRLFNARIRQSHIISRPAANGRNHALVNLEPGRWGVTQHLRHVLGVNPLSTGFMFYASTVSLLKEFMQARGMLGGSREGGLQALHNWACSETYRLIQRYRSDVPNGTSQREYAGGHTVQRTAGGKYLITSNVGGTDAVGAWTTVMKLRTADNGYGGVPSVRYGMAMRGAPSAVINGETVSMQELSNRLMRVRQRMHAA